MKDDAISFKALFSRFTGALSMSGRHLALHLIHAKANKADTRDPVRQAANDDRGTRTLVSHAPSEMTPPTRNGAEDKESTSSRQNKPLSREPGAGPPRLATNKRSAAVPLGALHQERIEPALATDQKHTTRPARGERPFHTAVELYPGGGGGTG